MQSPPRHGGNSWRLSNDFHPINDDFRQSTEFSFRNNDGAPQYPRKDDDYRSDDRESLREFQSDRRDRQDNGPERNRRRRTRGNYRGGRSNKIATAERPLLRSRQDTEPEQMFGIADIAGVTKRFISADDMSDSEEELMEESESDDDNSGGVSLITPGAEAMLEDLTPDGPERPAKRRALEVKKPVERVSAISKWSNPDPYTVLPPIDDTQRKKRDVVRIIRKARVSTEKAVFSQSQAAANDDYISFGFEEENTDTEENVTQKPSRNDIRPNGSGMLRGPSGSRQFSHRNNPRDQGPQKPPGSHSLFVSAEAMGPPPGLGPRANSASNHNNSQDVDSGRRTVYHDERNRFNPALKRKRLAGKEAVSGDLIEDWWPESNTEVTPWLENKMIRQSENAGFRLHKEICDFYEFVRPQKYEQAVRENLLQRLQAMVRNRLGCNVHSFGSFAAGLYLPNADMDVVVISDDFANYGEPTACQSSNSMYRFAGLLRDSCMVKDDSIEVITKAKVPIIKFVDRLTSIKVDMSFENYTGIFANKTFLNWKTQHPAIPILVTAIKQFLMMRGLNEVVNGGLGGFSVTCLVTSLLQNMPRVQTGELVPELHLGEILIEFLDFYGNQMDISRTGIMMDPPGYFDKCDRRNSSRLQNTERLAIMDPNQPGNDISGGSHNVTLILRCFSEAHNHILAAMRDPSRQSLLERTLGGNYESILWQRDHLRRIYEERWGSPVHGPVSRDRGHGNYNNVRQKIEGNDEQLHLRSRFPLPNPEQDARTDHQEQRRRTKLGKRQLARQVKAAKEEKQANKVAALNKDKNRATQLRREYPHCEIPDRLSKQAFKSLLLQLKQKGLLKKAARQPETANHGGISLSNPILID